MIELSKIFIYPVKSCRGTAVARCALFPEGLQNDRRWVIVDEKGQFLTQRQVPAMARIAVELLEPEGPGEQPFDLARPRHQQVPRLRLRIADGDGELTVTSPSILVTERDDAGLAAVQVWSFAGQAIDCGAAVAAFLGDFLGRPVRLLRFDDARPRPCNQKWTQGQPARTRFADGFPLLVLGAASVADLAGRMGLKELAIERFRPNLVISGLPAYEEDFIKTLEWSPEPAAGRPVAGSLLLVKPCTRCSIPSLNPRSGRAESGNPTALLATFRYHPAVQGAVLGVNALPLNAGGECLTEGQSLSPSLDF